MKLFLLMIALFFLVSCGKTKVEEKQEFVTYNSISYSPISLTSSQQVGCSVTVPLETPYVLISFYIDLTYQNLYTPLNTLLEGENYLRNSSSIAHTYYGYQEVSRYKAYYNEYYNDWSIDDSSLVQQIREGRELQFCSFKNSYESNSVEGAALNANYVISRAYNKLQQVAPELLPKPISIQIAPLYATEIHATSESGDMHATQYLTDNAFYSPANATITFLPQSQEGLDADVFAGKPLWDIPMVGAHEYGHHIFHHLFPEADNSEHSLCFDNRVHKGPRLREKDSSSFREVNTQTVFGALNEAFADLDAYYSLGDRLVSLKGITCMDKNRDVDIQYFSDGSEKRLSNKNVSTFFSFDRYNSAQTCFVPDFQDIHIMGAAIASLVYRQMKYLNMSDSEALTVLLQWIQSIRDDYLKDKTRSPRSVFSRSVMLFTQTLLRIEGEQNKRGICKIVNDLYPSSLYGLTQEVNPCRYSW